MSTIWSIDWRQAGRAVVSAVFVAVLAYMGNATTLTAIDPKQILSIAVIAAIASLAKAISSDETGKLGGVL